MFKYNFNIMNEIFTLKQDKHFNYDACNDFR